MRRGLYIIETFQELCNWRTESLALQYSSWSLIIFAVYEWYIIFSKAPRYLFLTTSKSFLNLHFYNKYVSEANKICYLIALQFKCQIITVYI